MSSAGRWPGRAAWLLFAAGIASPSGGLSAQALDTLIVEVRLDGVGRAIVLALPDEDAASVRLAAPGVFALAALEAPPRPFVTLAELQDLLGIDVVWLPERLLVILRDTRRVLPASRRQYDRLVAASRTGAGVALEQRRAGPFAAVTLDDRSEYLTEVGYSFGGLVGRLTHSSLSGTGWAMSVSPLSRLWISYRDGDRLDAALNARVALGRSWLSADYRNDRIDVAGATAIGPFVLFASTDAQMITWRGPVHIQVGRTNARGTLRMTYGPVPPSPFAIPAVR